MSGIVEPTPPRPASVASLNAAAVVIAALYFGRELIVPLVLAGLLAFVLAPVVGRLQRARLGHAPSVLLTVAAAVAIIGGIVLVVARQAASLTANLPAYGSAIQHKLRALPLPADLMGQAADAVQSVLGGEAPARAATDTGGSTLAVVRSVGEALLGPLSTVGVVAVFALFVLLSREDLRDRLVRLAGRHDLHRTILAMNDAARRLSRYFLAQLALNAGFGLFIGCGLWFIGLPNFVLFGVLAAIMRFVPYLGTFIAGAPALALALAVSPGWSFALAVLVMFAVSDLLVGQILEPLLYGHSTGLSPIAIVISAAFWTFLWGPVGLLIATPLTVCLVVVGRHIEQLRFLHIALGDSPPLDPEETFYQRALEGQPRELARQARRVIAETSLAEYYDRVALRGLALAQSDLSRDALAFDRLEDIHHRIEALLATVPAPPMAGPPPAPAWQAEGAVLCIPARGQLDDLTAIMAVQVLHAAGFGAQFAGNTSLGSGAAADSGVVRMCCLSVLEQGSNASAVRYLLRRMQKQMPGAVPVVCLWHASSASPLLQELRAHDDSETIVLSLTELVALARAVSARRAPVRLLPREDAIVQEAGQPAGHEVAP